MPDRDVRGASPTWPGCEALTGPLSLYPYLILCLLHTTDKVEGHPLLPSTHPGKQGQAGQGAVGIRLLS